MHFRVLLCSPQSWTIYYKILLSQKVRLPKMRWQQTTFRNFALFSSIMYNLLQNPDYGLPTFEDLCLFFEAFSLSKIGDPANYFELHDTLYTPSPITPLHQNPP